MSPDELNDALENLDPSDPKSLHNLMSKLSDDMNKEAEEDVEHYLEKMTKLAGVIHQGAPASAFMLIEVDEIIRKKILEQASPDTAPSPEYLIWPCASVGMSILKSCLAKIVREETKAKVQKACNKLDEEGPRRG